MSSVSNLRKPDLVEAIRRLGEEPPAEWKKNELKTRLLELEEQEGIHRHKGKEITDLQRWVLLLNKNAKKKDQLQAFCAQELKIPVNGNEVMKRST